MKNRMERQLEHPLVLFVYLAGGMLVTMMTMHPVLLGISFCFATAVAFFLWGNAMWKRWLGMILPVMFFMMVIMPLFSHRGVTPLFYINGLAVTKESVIYGFAVSLLLSAVFQWFQIANFLLDSEKLFYLFGRALPSMGLLLSLVFRMIPLMGERFHRICDAQRGMGRKKEELSLRGKISLFFKEISVLISWSLESSMEMAVSMENRGYGVGKRRFFSLFSFGKKEMVFLLLLVVFYGGCLGDIILGRYAATYFPGIQLMEITGRGIRGVCFFAMGVLLPLVWGGIEKERKI